MIVRFLLLKKNVALPVDYKLRFTFRLQASANAQPALKTAITHW